MKRRNLSSVIKKAPSSLHAAHRENLLKTELSGFQGISGVRYAIRPLRESVVFFSPQSSPHQQHQQSPSSSSPLIRAVNEDFVWPLYKPPKASMDDVKAFVQNTVEGKTGGAAPVEVLGAAAAAVENSRGTERGGGALKKRTLHFVVHLPPHLSGVVPLLFSLEADPQKLPVSIHKMSFEAVITGHTTQAEFNTEFRNHSSAAAEDAGADAAAATANDEQKLVKVVRHGYYLQLPVTIVRCFGSLEHQLLERREVLMSVLRGVELKHQQHQNNVISVALPNSPYARQDMIPSLPNREDGALRKALPTDGLWTP